MYTIVFQLFRGSIPERGSECRKWRQPNDRGKRP